MPKQRWYPVADSKIPKDVHDGFRRVLDMVYEQQDQGSPLSVYARGSATLTIGTSPSLVQGCSVILTRAGTWMVTGRFAINVIGAGDQAKAISGWLYVKGGKKNGAAVVKVPAAGTSVMASQVWQVTVDRNDMAVLRVSKETGATGTSTVDGANCTISAVWQGS